MVKNLFRINLTHPTNQEDGRFIEERESLRVTDSALSPFVDVHVLDVPISEARKKRITMYGRDLVTEWGNTLFVKPGLLTSFPLSLVTDSPFEKMMKRLGYDRKIIAHKVFSEGGLHVFGQEFILVSELYESRSKSFESIVKSTGLNVPIYFVPSLTSIDRGHIDCDYQVIDSLRLLYGGHNVFHGDDDKEIKARKRLEEIVRRHNFDLREYRSYDEELELMHLREEIDRYGTSKRFSLFSEDCWYELTAKENGINFILNGMLWTSSIHPKEKEYLERRGLNVVTIQLGKVSSGAGLRCVYGEFNL